MRYPWESRYDPSCGQLDGHVNSGTNLGFVRSNSTKEEQTDMSNLTSPDFRLFF
jgi:hypothetical protein